MCDLAVSGLDQRKPRLKTIASWRLLRTPFLVFSLMSFGMTSEVWPQPAMPKPRNVHAEPEQSMVAANAAARLPDSKVVLVVPAGKSKQLRVSQIPRPITLNDFGKPITLFGVGGILAEQNPLSVGIEVTGTNLHVLSAYGKRLDWHTTSVPVSDASKWQRQSVEMAGAVDLQDVVSNRRDRMYALCRQWMSDSSRWSLNIITQEAGKLRSFPIAESREALFGARGALSASGLLQVVWAESELAPRVAYAEVDAAAKRVLGTQILHDGMHPAIAGVGGRTFIASEQPDGSLRVEWLGPNGREGVQTLRGRAGYRPTLAADMHGVVWLFAIGTDQRGLFYRRFLGSGFGDESECGGAPGIWKLSLNFAVQPYVGEFDDGFALLHGEYLGEYEDYRYRFHNLPVPRYSVRDSRHVLFLDLLEVAEIENLQQKVSTAVRSEANPLNLNGPRGSHDAAVAGYATVMRENGKFRMWYNADSDLPGRTWVICYAESNDGVHWMKPDLGLFEYKGSKKNNLLFPIEYKTSAPFIIRDDRETDAARRYKMVMESGYTGATSVYLAWSPDGIHWQWPPHPLWVKGSPPDVPESKRAIKGFHPWHEPLSSFFYDPLTTHPNYRWKIYGQDAYAAYPNHDPRPVRNLSLVYGETPYDFVGYEGNPVMEPRTGYQEDQIHGGMVQPYHGMYLTLYQHWWGDDWYNDLRLAASRDGIHFVRVQPQTAVLPLGASGSWDSGMVTTPNFVFLHEGKLWLYYRGSAGTLATGRAIQDAAGSPHVQQMGEAWSMMTGLARLREDGFAFLTPGPMERLAQPPRTTAVPNYRLPLLGRVVTIPIEADGIAGRKLHINVEYFAPGIAWLRAQLRDADSGKEIEGYRFEDCDEVREAALNRRITWKGNADLSRVKARRIRVEFQLFGTLDAPKLYSFWFE